MNRVEAEISRVQTALWMSEKLARLCRESIRARDRDDCDEIERLAGEIETLVRSDTFIAAVDAVSPEYFYPDKLRIILDRMKCGISATIKDAARYADAEK